MQRDDDEDDLRSFFADTSVVVVVVSRLFAAAWGRRATMALAFVCRGVIDQKNAKCEADVPSGKLPSYQHPICDRLLEFLASTNAFCPD